MLVFFNYGIFSKMNDDAAEARERLKEFYERAQESGYFAESELEKMKTLLEHGNSEFESMMYQKQIIAETKELIMEYADDMKKYNEKLFTFLLERQANQMLRLEKLETKLRPTLTPEQRNVQQFGSGLRNMERTPLGGGLA